MTNIADLPLLGIAFQTRTNEDWVDAVSFGRATRAISYPKHGNVGGGTLGTVQVFAGAPVGISTVVITNVDDDGIIAFGIFAPDGTLVGIGDVGIPFSSSQFAFTLTAQGSIPFVENDSFIIHTVSTPIDITGIDFVMAVRLTPDNPTQVLSAATADATMLRGDATGVVGVNFLWPQIAQVGAGTFVLDVVAQAEGRTKTVITGTLTIVHGSAVPRVL